VTRHRKDDRGASIVELSVAVLIGALLMAATAAAFIGSLRTVRSVNASTSSVADARTAMEAVSRTLRVAYRPIGQPAAPPAAVVSAGPNNVRFWALLNRSGGPTLNDPPATLVDYAYSGGCLTETQTVGGVTRSKCLVRTNPPPISQPTFTYFSTGAATVNGAPVTALPTTPPDLTAIRSVQVRLTVRTPGNPDATDLPVVTRVTLENVPAAGG
jgi:type II secretory pathway component PulJ